MELVQRAAEPCPAAEADERPRKLILTGPDAPGLQVVIKGSDIRDMERRGDYALIATRTVAGFFDREAVEKLCVVLGIRIAR